MLVCDISLFFKIYFLQAFEPSEIERGFFTDQDNEIRVTDMPERFQLRQVPVKPTEEGEIEEESEWIYKQAFSTPPTSQQVGNISKHKDIAIKKPYPLPHLTAERAHLKN